MQHVKPHGALYNMAAVDQKLSDAIAKAVYKVDPGLILYGTKKFQAGELDWAGMPLGQLPTESLPTLKKTVLYMLSRLQECIGTNSTLKLSH